jgi:hypothetical protein
MKLSVNGKKLIYIAIVIVIIICIVTIRYLYIITPNKKEELRVEFAKILSQGVVLGILGFWFKYAIDETIKKRDYARVKQGEKEKLDKERVRTLTSALLELRNKCHKIEGFYNAVTLTRVGLVGMYRPEILDLLDKWELLESNSGVVNEVRKKYNEFYDTIMLKSIVEINNEERQQVKDKFTQWSNNYSEMIDCLLSNEKNYTANLKW